MPVIVRCRVISLKPATGLAIFVFPKELQQGGAFTAQSTVFDISNPLLEGYGSQDTNATDSHNPLGCIDYNSVSNAYMVGVFIHSMGRQQLAKTGCRELLNGLHVVVRYIALSSLSRSTP